MAIKTQPQINSEIQNSFLDNNAGLITPAIMRAFQQDMSDTMFANIGLTNTREAQTSSYVVVNGNKGQTIALSGADNTLTLNAASGYDSNFLVMLVNEDTTNAWNIAANAVTAFFLYPGQAIVFLAQNNKWYSLGRSRWKIPAGITTTFYVNSGTGSDSNDGLSSGTAKATVQAALYQIANDVDFSIASSGATAIALIQMQANDTTGVHWGVQGLSGGVSGGNITIDGGGFSLSNGSNTDAAFHLFFQAQVYLQNITLIPSTAHAAVQLEDASHINFKAGIVWGNGSSTGGAHLQMEDNSSAEFDDANMSISGNAGYFVFMDGGASLRTPGNTVITVTTNVSFITTVIATNGGIANFSGASFSLGAHTVTAKRWEADNLALVNSGTGAPNTFFPGSSNGTTSGGGQGV